MTNEQETAHIHELLDLMKGRAGAYDIASEGAQQLGFSSHDAAALVQRLQSESLATSTFGSSMTLTSLGSQIAREEGGYLGHAQRQEKQQQLKDQREGRSALGSFLSGWAGVIGLFLSSLSLYESYRSSSEADDLRAQIKELQQKQVTTETRVTTLERRGNLLIQPSAAPTLPKHSKCTQQQVHKH